jgi:hypothetical protein
MGSTIEFLKTFFDGSTGLRHHENPFVVLERRLVILAILLILASLVVNGCSPTTRIAKATTGIAEAASSSKNRFAVIQAEAEAPAPNLPLIKEEAVGGVSEQSYILSFAGSIQEALPSVEDQVPPWMNLIQYGIIVAGILGVAWILWYTGIGSLIKGLLGFIPKAKRREADLANMMLDEKSPVTVREFIAARRASDPEFDKAYATTHRKRSEKN